MTKQRIVLGWDLRGGARDQRFWPRRAPENVGESRAFHGLGLLIITDITAKAGPGVRPRAQLAERRIR